MVIMVIIIVIIDFIIISSISIINTDIITNDNNCNNHYHNITFPIYHIDTSPIFFIGQIRYSQTVPYLFSNGAPASFPPEPSKF